MYCYLDNNATTKPSSEMMDDVTEKALRNFGNPSSTHEFGENAADELHFSREQVAKAIGSKTSEVIFTSGGTESNNLALNIDKTVIGSAVEHSSVTSLIDVQIKVDNHGLLDFNSFEDTNPDPNTIVSVMLANNETGVILDPEHKLFELKDKYGFILHVDAVQGLGKLEIDVSNTPIDLLSISAHKVHGFKGVGALYISQELDKVPRSLLSGGAHERGFRAGTQNQIGILSLGYMCSKISKDGLIVKDVGEKRDYFECLLKDISEVNGSTEHRTCNTSNLYLKDLPSNESSTLDQFLMYLSNNGVYVSGKSACASGMPAPSKTLTEMFGKDSDRLNKSIRVSLSKYTTEEEILQAAKVIQCGISAFKAHS